MNLNDLKSFVEEVLSNPEGVTDVNEVMEKALTIYRDLNHMFLQATPSERERITEALEEIGQLFEKKFEDLSEKMGMTKEELIIAMKDPSNYTPEVWESVQSFQKSVDEEKSALIKEATNESKAQMPIKKVKKTRATRVFA